MDARERGKTDVSEGGGKGRRELAIDSRDCGYARDEPTICTSERENGGYEKLLKDEGGEGD